MKMFLSLGFLLIQAVITMGCHGHGHGHHGHHRSLNQDEDQSKQGLVQKQGECSGPSICVDDLFPPILFQILEFFLNLEPTGQRRTVNSMDDKNSMDKMDEMVGQFCLAGTSMGDNMQKAVKLCSKAQVGKTIIQAKPTKGKGKRGKWGKGKGRGNGKGGPRKCPKSENMIERIQNETAYGHCIMKEMGWIDLEGKLSYESEAALADINSLNQSIAENINKEDIEKCINEEVSTMKKGALYKRCEDKYTQEEKSQLKDVINDKIVLKCTKEIFIKSCSNYVAQSFMTCIPNN